MKTRILFVCMGNICRSPTAEGVLKEFVHQAGLNDEVEIDSAGTHAYHVGNPPDARTVAAAARRGYDLSPLRARQVIEDDFSKFDYVLAMDWENLALLQRLCPPAYAHRLMLVMRFAVEHEAATVPDPYYGGSQGFEQVLDYIEDACEGLLDLCRKRVTMVANKDS